MNAYLYLIKYVQIYYTYSRIINILARFDVCSVICGDTMPGSGGQMWRALTVPKLARYNIADRGESDLFCRIIPTYQASRPSAHCRHVYSVCITKMHINNKLYLIISYIFVYHELYYHFYFSFMNSDDARSTGF